MSAFIALVRSSILANFSCILARASSYRRLSFIPLALSASSTSLSSERLATSIESCVTLCFMAWSFAWSSWESCSPPPFDGFLWEGSGWAVPETPPTVGQRRRTSLTSKLCVHDGHKGAHPFGQQSIHSCKQTSWNTCPQEQIACVTSSARFISSKQTTQRQLSRMAPC